MRCGRRAPSFAHVKRGAETAAATTLPRLRARWKSRKGHTMCAGMLPLLEICCEDADTQKLMRITACKQNTVGQRCSVAVRRRAWQKRKRAGSSAAAAKQRWWMLVKRRPQFVSVENVSQN